MRSISRIALCFGLAAFATMLHAAEIPAKSKVEALVQQLGDEKYSVRQKADKELKGMGESVVKQLRTHLKDPDPEVRERVQGVLDYVATLRKELKWLDPKNLGKAGYISDSMGHSVQLTFRNLTKQPVRIYWIETDGNLRSWRGILQPDASAVCARSYIGHAWLITDVNKKHLGIYKINLKDPVLAVREEDLKK